MIQHFWRPVQAFGTILWFVCLSVCLSFLVVTDVADVVCFCFYSYLVLLLEAVFNIWLLFALLETALPQSKRAIILICIYFFNSAYKTCQGLSLGIFFPIWPSVLVTTTFSTTKNLSLESRWIWKWWLGFQCGWQEVNLLQD